MKDPIDWALAERVARRVSGRGGWADSYHYDSLESDFERLTAVAESLVQEATGLSSLSGPARARLSTRTGWVHANVASFRRLLRPVTERLAERMAGRKTAGLARRVAGVQLGTMLGWMSTRVLGQYDILLVEDDQPDDQDLVYYVGPNVLEVEKRFGFPPEQFRLWLALHEVTHRVQFTGVPWMRPHFASLVESVLSHVDPDPKRLLEALKRARSAMRENRDVLKDGGLAMLLTTPEQRAVLEQVQALMSLLEGHGDITMNRAGGDRVPEAQRFSRILQERRSSARGLNQFLQRALGIEAKLRQYEAGERFVEAIESQAGHDVFKRVWIGPEWLPTWEELRDPPSWIGRIQQSIPTGQ